jgi:tetratricopeptide (TPR) repeat protein
VYQAQDRLEDALVEDLAAALVDPANANAFAAAGQLRADQGDDAGAITLLRSAVRLDANHGAARYALGRALLRAGRADEAREQLAAFERIQKAEMEAQRRRFEENARALESAVSKDRSDAARRRWPRLRRVRVPRVGARGARPASPAVFEDVATAAGLAFRHTNGASPDKYLAETMGSGAVFFDADGDGWIDLFLVDGGSIADPAVAAKAQHRLFRNQRNGTFADVTATSRIRPPEYGMGACAGDVDNDGRVDLYVTGYGANALFHNDGGLVFSDVTARPASGRRAGARAARSSTSIATATWICSSPTTSDAARPTTGSAAIRSGAFASTVIR